MNNRAAKACRRAIRRQLSELDKQLPTVAYSETGTHVVSNLNDPRNGTVVSDPVKMTQHCERKFFKNAKFNYLKNSMILRKSGMQFDTAVVIAMST